MVGFGGIALEYKGLLMSYDRKQAAHEFGRWSENYDRSILQWLLFRPAHQAIIARIAAAFGDQPLAILDVGCGTGVFAARVREALPQAKVWGVDLVAGMLAKGRTRWHAHRGSVVPIQGDSERLPFREGAFDVVTCSNSFHHYPHQERAVEEMRRVLKPGGRLVLVDGSRDDPWGWFIYDICVASIEGDVLHASKRRVRSLFAQAGFVGTEQELHQGLAPFLLSEGVAGHAHKSRIRSLVPAESGPRMLPRENKGASTSIPAMPFNPAVAGTRRPAVASRVL
jgi:ubiquinone/menaquinone biosynthesis C-methylase UbiE